MTLPPSLSRMRSQVVCCNLWPLHKQAKNHYLVMVRTLDYHLKAVPWVLGKPFYVVMGPQGECEVRVGHVARSLHIFVGGKREEDLVSYNMSQTLSI